MMNKKIYRELPKVLLLIKSIISRKSFKVNAKLKVFDSQILNLIE